MFITSSFTPLYALPLYNVKMLNNQYDKIVKKENCC